MGIVSDHAAQAASTAYSKQLDYNDNHTDAIRSALTAAALPYLAASVEVRELEWSRHKESDKDCGYDHITAKTNIGDYQIEWKSWKDRDGHVVYLSGYFILCEYDLAEAKAAAHADYNKRILSAIKTKTVDLAAVREDGDCDINTYRDLSISAIADLKNYADDDNGVRLMVSHHGYLEELERLDAIRALSPAEPVDQWQDIATAPKDVEVLVGAFVSGEFITHVYRIIDKYWREQWDEYEPTHWMPLPAAPTSKGGE